MAEQIQLKTLTNERIGGRLKKKEKQEKIRKKTKGGRNIEHERIVKRAAMGSRRDRDARTQH